MISAPTEHHLITNIPKNPSKGRQFGLVANAKMFDILFSGIYSYKIAAIVREITSNAYDAHARIGATHVPFNITVPNEHHMFFEVEDFGVGMDADDALEVYSVMGASTKGESNDEIGAFGIGAKTPFAYTSQFTIRTRKDGVERVMIAYIPDEGTPWMDIVAEIPCNEPNGVKVTVPVRPEDVEEFRAEVAFYASFFPTTPKLIGQNIKPMYEFPEGALASDTPYAIPEKYNTYNKKAALQGNSVYIFSGPVAFPIALQSVYDDFWSHDGDLPLIRAMMSMKSSPIFIKTKIGEVKPSSSRESIQMTPATRDLIKERISHVCDEIKDKYRAISKNEDIHPCHRHTTITTELGDLGEFLDRNLELEDRPHLKYMNREFLGKSVYVRVLSQRYKKKTFFDRMPLGNTIMSYYLRAKGIDSSEPVLNFITNTKGIKIRKPVIDEFCDMVRPLYVKGMTPSSAKRISAVLGVKVSVEDYSTFHQAHLADRKANRVSRVGVTVNRLPDDVVHGSYYTIQKDADDLYRCEYSVGKNLRVNPKNTFYVESSGPTHVSLNGSFIDRDGFGSVMRSLINPDALTKVDGRIYIVRRSSRNEKKLERLNIRPVSEIFETGLTHSKEVIVHLSVLGNLSGAVLTALDMMSETGFNKNVQLTRLCDRIKSYKKLGLPPVGNFARNLVDVTPIVQLVGAYVNDQVTEFYSFIDEECKLIRSSSSIVMYDARESKEFREEFVKYIKGKIEEKGNE